MSQRLQVSVRGDGTFEIDGNSLKIPNYSLGKFVGAGASGEVYTATHDFLERDAAVKIWLKRRSHDIRDKFRQGIEEAKKAATATSLFAPQIFDAGEVGGYFYCAMEHIEGVPLKILQGDSRLPLLARHLLATKYLNAINAIEANGIVHGDPHGNNVLVTDDRIILIDFGSSNFIRGGREAWRERHWRTVRETLRVLLRPLPIRSDAPAWLLDRSLADYILGIIYAHHEAYSERGIAIVRPNIGRFVWDVRPEIADHFEREKRRILPEDAVGLLTLFSQFGAVGGGCPFHDEGYYFGEEEESWSMTDRAIAISKYLPDWERSNAPLRRLLQWYRRSL
jgi:serine/threonine protein kinase